MKVNVHTITAEVLGADDKTYVGSIAFGSDSWAALDPAQHDHGREAAKVVAVRHAESMGVEAVGEPKIITEADEEIEIEDPA